MFNTENETMDVLYSATLMAGGDHTVFSPEREKVSLTRGEFRLDLWRTSGIIWALEFRVSGTLLIDLNVYAIGHDEFNLKALATWNLIQRLGANG